MSGEHLLSTEFTSPKQPLSPKESILPQLTVDNEEGTYWTEMSDIQYLL